MANPVAGEVFESLGVRPVINAVGNRTVLGGSTLSPEVREVMEAANHHYVEMSELLEKSGEHIAGIVGAEAAYVTSGCAAALTLSASACMTGLDAAKIAQLPDTTGMKSDILLQKKQRYGYDRCYSVTGATLVEVGDDDGCTPEQLEAAIGPDTAAVAYYVQPDWDSSVVTLEDAIGIAHGRGVPVIADAASQIYPLDYMTRNASEPDLTCFGSKYFGAPHSTGFVCGRKDLVDSVAAQGFIGYHTGGRIAIGRALKVDRQDVMAVVTALDAWFSMNHEDRLMENDRRLSGIRAKLQGIPGVTATVDQRKRYWGFTLLLKIGPDAGKTAAQVVKELDEGTPRILVETEGDDTVTVVAHTLNEGEEDIVADRLIEVLSG